MRSLLGFYTSTVWWLLRSLLLDRRGITRVPTRHSQPTTFISIFQIFCLKLAWIYHLTNSAVKPNFLSVTEQKAVETKVHRFLSGTGILSVSPADCWPTDTSLCPHSWQGLLQIPSHHWFDHIEMREDVVLKPWMPFTLRLLCHLADAVQHGLFSCLPDEMISLGDFKELGGTEPPAFSERVSSAFLQFIKHIWKGCRHPLKTLL